jgi:mono/diheme cytochrome c family protein
MRAMAISMALAALSACAAGEGTTTTTTSDADTVASGQMIAEATCAACHAVGREGASPNPAAPPLRTAAQRVDLDVLETEFAEGMRVGHAGMPDFQFDLEGVDALLAYLRSIQEPAASEMAAP